MKHNDSMKKCDSHMKKCDAECQKKMHKDAKEMMGSMMKKHEKTMHSNHKGSKGSY